MKLSNFNFELPSELLAEYPSENRDESKLMVIHRDSGKIEHKMFKDLIDYLFWIIPKLEVYGNINS